MQSTSRGRRAVVAGIRWAALPLLFLTGMTIPAQASSAAPARSRAGTVIVLPGATSAEGIAAGRGNTFYAGDLFAGNIYRGNVQRGTAELFIDAPDGRQAVGMAFDQRRNLLFVAGGMTGDGYVYDPADGSTVATYDFGGAGTSFINDVVVTRQGAWFTDSLQPVLYFVPIDSHGTLGDFTTLELSGPAADLTGPFNLNGIQATPNGRTLIVSHSGNGRIYTVDPDTGESALIEGISVPNVDGLVLRGGTLWAVQNFSNQISRIRLARDLGSGEIVDVITSSQFAEPSTAAPFGNLLAAVNTHFATGIPPTADHYEIVLVNAR